jgi:DNA-binding MarR family transcriptional regulator
MTGTSGRGAAPRDPAGEFPFPVAPYLFHLFTVIARLRDAKLDKALKPFGLNVTRHRAIAVIALLEPCTMSELADLSAIDRTTMTRIVDQLVARDLAERATPSEDRRQVVLTLTEKGRAVYQGALKAIGQVNREALEGLSDETLRAAARAQQTILVNLAPDPVLAQRLLEFRRS